MTGDCHVRFCERLGVKSPRSTRQEERVGKLGRSRIGSPFRGFHVLFRGFRVTTFTNLPFSCSIKGTLPVNGYNMVNQRIACP